MQCNWRRWLWGLIPLVMLAWVAIQAERPGIERELTEGATTTLAQSGASWAQASFQGRDGVLVGRAWDEDDVDKVLDALRKVPGVRIVDNKAALIEKADIYLWAAGRRNHRIRLTGYVPNFATRQAILGVTKANFPGYEVVDRMTLMRGVPSADAWLGGISFALKQLASMRRGEVRLENLGLSVAGEAEDLAAFRSIKAALLNNAPKGIKITSDQLTAPAISPYVWSAQLADGKLELGGYFPEEAARAELMAAAKSALPGGTAVDRMQLGHGAPQDWARASAVAVRVLGKLEGGSVEMKDATLIVSGVAADEAAAEAVRGILRTDLPPTVKLTEQIRARERRAGVEAPRVTEPDPALAKPDAPAKSDAPAKTETRVEVPALPKAAEPEPPRVETKAQVVAKACQSTLVELTKAGQILFERASAELDGASSTTLAKLAQAVKSCPDVVVRIEGHTDMEGTSESNLALSLRRAQSVLDYMVKAGVDGRQLEPAGFGEKRPVAPNDTNENRAKNRRIEFEVRPK